MSNIGWSPIWILTLLFYCVSSLSPAKQGFNDKFMSTRQQLTKTIYQNSRDQNNLRINTTMLWSQPLEMARNSNVFPNIISTNRHTVMLNNMDLWIFKDGGLHHGVTLESHIYCDVNCGVQFAKAFEWQGRLFLLVCFQNSVCSLYSTSSNFDSITYHQSISDNGDPTDAQFFVQRGKLFLTVLFHEHSFSVQFKRTSSRLRIYQWRDLYMDPELIPEIVGSTATCIALFSYEEDIVLVLGCPGEHSLKFPSQVWSRKPSGEMSLVQYLRTDRPLSINHFMERGENFIIISEKDRESSIFWWEGSEFVRWLSVDGVEKYFRVTVSSNLKYTTFLTFTHGNILRIYLMTSVKLDKIYETEFSSGIPETLSILRVSVFEENGITYMLVLTKSESLVYISMHKINVEILDTIASEVSSNDVHRSDTAQEALDTVFRAVTSFKYKMENLDTLSSSLLFTNMDATIGHGVVTGEISVESGEIRAIIHSHRDIAQFMGDLYTQISPITEEINSAWRKLQTTPLYEPRQLFYLGKVVIKQAKINSIKADIVNDDKFDPSSFLFVTKAQQRLKSIKAKNLKVDWLALKKIGDKKAEDVVLADSRVTVPITVAGLEGRNLRIDERMTINNIAVKDLTDKLVTVETEEDAFNKISQMGAGTNPARPPILRLQDNTVIQNLNVDFVNNVSLNEILTSLYIIGSSNNVIYGDIHFQAGVRTKQMAAETFHSPETKDTHYTSPEMVILPPLTNIPPPQMNIPPSQMNILPPQMNILPPLTNIPPSQMNILPPLTNIPPSQMNIRPPQLNIYPRLQPQVPFYRPYPPPVQQYPQYWAPFNPFILNERRMKRDTFEDEENTIRKGKVKIVGDLKVARLLFQNSSMVVNNHSVPTSDLGKTFWTTSTSQTINESVHFSQGITIQSDLESMLVNGKNLSSYASRKSTFNSLELENIHVDGNIVTGDDAKIWVPENELQGSVFKVLNVKHLNAEKINGDNTETILRASDLLGEGITIIADNLEVGGDLEANRINNIDVNKKFKTAVMTDQSFVLNEVEFKNISGDNIKVKSLNNNLIESAMGFSSKENSTVFIRGDIHISQLSKVTSINNYPANFTKVVNKVKGATIYGKKRFPAQVIILKELKITNINNINFEHWLKNLLRVSGEQEVAGYYTIRNAEMKSEFNVSSINGISLSNFVYTNQPKVMLPSNVRFKTITVDGNVNSASLHGTCQLPKAEDEIVFEQSSEWSAVEIVGDSDWPKTEGDRLQHLFESAVTTHGDQTITGDVTIQLMSVPKVRVQSLNDKNITFIFQDSLSRQKENQVISGKKTFFKSFKCKNIEVKGDAQLKSVNDIDINDIEERLVRHSGDGKEIVSGHKRFLNGFKAFSLECPEGINGIKAENIVSRKFKGEAPPFVVQSLRVFDSLYVETINDLNLKEFLKECIYLNRTEKQRILGRLHIKGNVSLQGDITTSSINNISINDVVFLTDKKKPVKINGCKRFSSHLQIKSDPDIHILNDRNLTRAFGDNVKIDQNVTINGSVVFESQVEVDTIYAREYFVGPKQLVYLNKSFTP